MGQTSDLKADWSNSSNPNGRWSYRQGDVPLPKVASWQRNLGGWNTAQPGWASSEDGNNRLPFWFKSNGSETFARDFVTGDVVVHSWDGTNGSGNSQAKLAWTSPGFGVVKITGAAWMGRDIGRSVTFYLTKGCTLLSTGALSSGDPYSRANPFTFAAGAPTTTTLDAVAVRPGSEIVLELRTTSGSGDFVGVNMTVQFESVIPGCDADFNGDGFITFEDFDAFVSAFETGLASSDFNGDGCLDFTDFDDFVTSFEAGC
ncbi:MAG: EF-hand domain-containing protein [Planctomycetota bacterium]|nr:EF-hand domain-containing protein [Planctomycetota bacterium]